MNGNVLAKISESAPYGEEVPSLEALAADRPLVQCSYCYEAVVHDGTIWRHVRTGLSADWRSKECHPPCRDCDREGLIAIGGDQFVGSGIRFVVDHFACLEHSSGAFIHRT